MQHGVKRQALSEHARRSKAEKDKLKIANYRALSDRVLRQKANKIYTLETLENTTKLLEVNPEYNAVWNYRRHIFNALFEAKTLDRTQALNGDLMMSLEMMKRLPKCYWIWNHRRWCLEELETNGGADWARELGFVHKLLTMDSRNFHGWHYRRYVVDQMKRKLSGADEKQKILAVLLREFDYTTENITKSTANFSAWHNRTKLIPEIFSLVRQIPDLSFLEQQKATAERFLSPTNVLQHELNMVKTGMFMDSNDTSVWLYMQWLLTDSQFMEDLVKDSSESYLQILQQQLKDVEELNSLEIEDSPTDSDNVWCLKMEIFIRALINRTSGSDIMDEFIESRLQKLIKLDELRSGLYRDQISGAAPIIT